MADLVQHKADDHHQQQTEEQCSLNDGNTSSLIDQIYKQLICMREDNLELTEKLMSVYNDLCHFRQSLTNPQLNSNTDIATVSIQIDSPTSSRYQSKQRSDSEPNILSDRLRLITIIDDLQ